jgi:hypothetical protein
MVCWVAIAGQVGDWVTTMVALLFVAGVYESNGWVVGDATGGELYLRITLAKILAVGILLAYRRSRIVQVAGAGWGCGAAVCNVISMLGVMI